VTDPRYRGQHQAIRRATVRAAYGTPCVRCGQVMLPGQRLHLDHTDDGTGYLGYSHAACNVRAGASKGGRERARRARERKRIAVTEIALGIEVSEDRAHTSIATAGALDDTTVLIDVAHYLDGTDRAVATVVELKRASIVVGVALDASSPTRSLLQPLEAAGIAVLALPTTDAAVAHAMLRDQLAAGRLRHGGSPELERAVRAADIRPVGGQAAWQRRGTTVDLSPLAAASLALFAWWRRPPPAPDPWVAVLDDGPAVPVDREARAVRGVAPGLGRNPAPPPLPTPRGLPGVQRL
jgi:hypothetical protein